MKAKKWVGSFFNFAITFVLLMLIVLSGYVCKQTYANKNTLEQLMAVSVDGENKTNDGEPMAPVQSKSGSIQIRYQGNDLICANSVFPLDAGNGLTAVVISLPDEVSAVAYDKSTGYLAVDHLGDTVIFSQQAVLAPDSDTGVSLYAIKNDDNECILGTSVMKNTEVVTFCQSSQNREGTLTFIEQTLKSLAEWNGQLDLSVCDLVLDAAKLSSDSVLQINDSICHLAQDGYVMNFSLNSIESSQLVLPNKFVSADSDTFLYGNFMEAGSNLQPFLYETDDGKTLKIVSSLETLEKVFPK